MTFQEWVQSLIDRRFGTATALAKAIGMQLSPFTRGVANGTLNLVNLLRLAQVAEEHPSTVLRLARKSDEAALLEELYGSGREALTPSMREVIEIFQQIPDEVREPFFVVLRHARDVAVHGAPPPPPQRSAAPPEARPRRRRVERRRPRAIRPE